MNEFCTEKMICLQTMASWRRGLNLALRKEKACSFQLLLGAAFFPCSGQVEDPEQITLGKAPRPEPRPAPH